MLKSKGSVKEGVKDFKYKGGSKGENSKTKRHRKERKDCDNNKENASRIEKDVLYHFFPSQLYIILK